VIVPSSAIRAGESIRPPPHGRLGVLAGVMSGIEGQSRYGR
jgi:hypothetical protein